MRTVRIALFIFLTLAAVGCSAQINHTLDSIRVVDAEWRTDSLDGFLLKRYHFGEGSLFCSAQNLCLIEIPAGSPRRLAFTYDTVLTEVSALAERYGAFAAVNGSYFDMDLGNPICYLRIDGQQVGENTPGKEDSVNRKYYQYATLALRDGRPQLLVPDSSRFWAEGMTCGNVMTAGPMLLRKGELVPQRDDRTFVTHRHNRTALGIRPDGTTLLLVADGRFKHKAEGLSLNELELEMRWLGCCDAINLDGGGSSTMYVHENPQAERSTLNGVVNHPSDNRNWDREGERPVSNAIIVL